MGWSHGQSLVSCDSSVLSFVGNSVGRLRSRPTCFANDGVGFACSLLDNCMRAFEYPSSAKNQLKAEVVKLIQGFQYFNVLFTVMFFVTNYCFSC